MMNPRPLPSGGPASRSSRCRPFTARLASLLLCFAADNLRAGDGERAYDYAGTIATMAAFFDANGIAALDLVGEAEQPFTYTLDQTHEVEGPLHVGYENSFNLLTISGENVAVASAGAVIGALDGSADNAVFVGRLASWTVNGELFIGQGGSRNTLSISDGGSVTGTAAYIGGDSTSAGNTVTVTGEGSSWNNSGALYLGYTYGSNGNTLTIAGGAGLTGASGSIGENSDGNTVSVQGGGSVWTLGGTGLIIGTQGSGNTLSIGAGGGVAANAADSYTIIGYGETASGNAVVVADAGSRWDTHQLTVGYEGTGNVLDILSGGKVASYVAYLGQQGAASGNIVTVSGESSAWTISRYLYAGYSGSRNEVSIKNGGRIAAACVSIGENQSATANKVIVTGAGSALSAVSGGVFVGYIGSKNSMDILEGAVVSGASGYIGYNREMSYPYANRYETASDDNAVLVSGTGSTWRNTGELHVGRGGSGNSLTVADGGTVTSATGFIGYFEKYVSYPDSVYIEESSDNNTVTVTGSGSQWDNTAELYVGRGGSGNSLAVLSGGRVSSGTAYIGYQGQVVNDYNNPGETNPYKMDTRYASDANSALVSGAGSRWTNTSGLYVGYGSASTSNRLTVSLGGSVTSGSGYVGYGAKSTHASAVVTGVNSSWGMQSGELYVGYNGTSHQLTISDGGRVANTNGYIGRSAASSGNTVLVTGEGSRWDNTNLYIGGKLTTPASGNALAIAGGGLVTVTTTLNIRDGNWLRLDGGFLAWEGNHLDALSVYIAAGKIQLYDDISSSWVGVTDSSLFSFTYIALNDTGASSTATGGRYANLAGYTILSDLVGSAVPEPAAYAALTGLVILACVLLCRRRTAHGPSAFHHPKP